MPSLFLLVAEDDELVSGIILPHPPLPTENLIPEPPPAQLSLHALSGHSAPKTLRLKGSINELHISILIDGGSTHNFLHHRVVTTLGLTTKEIAPLKVTVGNEDEIRCQQLCTAVKIQIQEHAFMVDFHILPLCGAGSRVAQNIGASTHRLHFIIHEVHHGGQAR